MTTTYTLLARCSRCENQDSYSAFAPTKALVAAEDEGWIIGHPLLASGRIDWCPSCAPEHPDNMVTWYHVECRNCYEDAEDTDEGEVEYWKENHVCFPCFTDIEEFKRRADDL